MESLQRLMLKGVKLLLIIEVTANIIGKEKSVQDKWKELNHCFYFQLNFVKLPSKLEIFN